MTAVDAFRIACALGVRIEFDGSDLVLEAPVAPPDDVLDLLRHHKFDIVALLRARANAWCAQDWQAYFEERAAVAEFEGGLERPGAEAQAFECTVVRWLTENPAQSMPGVCLACGGVDRAHDCLLPFGAEPTGHVWLHSECWAGWHRGRRAEAIAALAELGVQAPSDVRGLGDPQ